MICQRLWQIAAAAAFALSAEPQHPIFSLINQSSGPVISEEQIRQFAGHGFEGGRVVKDDDGIYWLFTAEFQGLPINANMRLGLWRAVQADGPWERHSTIADQASQGDPTSEETWAKTCRADNFEASPWAPFPLWSEEEDRWHVHWISYACDMSWVVRVGVGNIFGAVSQTPGRRGIAGPYKSYGIIIGPNASTATATVWGDLGSCAPCHSGGNVPPYCSEPPCMYDNTKTGAAIGTGPWVMPPGSPTRYAAFVGLDHQYAGANSPRGPWTVYTSAQMGMTLLHKMSTMASPYSENPVVSEITRPDGSQGFVATFDTVSASGGWTWDGDEYVPAGLGEWHGLGMSYSHNGQYWLDGVDLPLEGGARTPLGFIEESDGTYTLLFTRRFGDCQDKTLPKGSRGDAANDPTMCALLYRASYSVSWEKSTSSTVV